MAKEECKTIEKAMQLISHTFDITNNINRYPKKLRHSLVDRMQITSFDIYEYLDEANGMDLRWEKKERINTLFKAVRKCNRLAFYIKLSHEKGLINIKSTEYWSKMVTDVKNMTLGMIRSDKQR